MTSIPAAERSGIHLLVSAYECLPGAGTEAGNGWGWATHLAARGIRVHVITQGSQRLAIEHELAQHPLQGIEFSFTQPTIRSLRSGHGPHYLLWQWEALRLARASHRRDPFDLAHHVTYGSVHVPSQLWRLGIPLIFGPIGGGQVSPYSMRTYFGASKNKELIRTLFTRLLPFSPWHRWWIKRMAVVYTSNEETLKLVQRLGSKRAALSCDTGLPTSFFAAQHRSFAEDTGCLRLLWVGRMLPRKAIALALDALQKTSANTHLTIVGYGIKVETLRAMITDRNLNHRVDWSGGPTPWTEVRQAYASHDALLFTSLRDSCGSQLLEAMAAGLPIITLDHQGAHSLVPQSAGVKVAVSDQAGTINALAKAIEAYAELPAEQRNAMSRAGLEASRQYAWDKRADHAAQLYRRVLNERSGQEMPGTSTETPGL